MRLVLSYGGWTIFPTTNTVIDEGWWAPSVLYASGGEDLYFFATSRVSIWKHSCTHISCSGATTSSSFLGVWWSRWNKYSELELRKIISEFERNLIPLDGIRWTRSGTETKATIWVPMANECIMACTIGIGPCMASHPRRQ